MRRQIVAGLALVAVAGCSTAGPAPTATAPAPAPTATVRAPAPTSTVPATARAAGHDDLARLEREHDARLGVYAVDTGSGRTVAYRPDTRFAHASTIKALAAGAVLQRTSPAELDEVVRYGRGDLLAHSPVTQGHAGTGMTVRELADAAVRYSDNTAAALLLEQLGGPAGLDAALAQLGDEVTSVDRTEPALNEAAPGDVRDTSTPRALAEDLRALTLGDALPEQDRALLIGWLRGNTTGDDLVRAGVPAGWDVGDRTGAGGYGTLNDLAVVWPPGRAPLVLAVMSRRGERDAEPDDALLAEAARVVVAVLS